jgi:hypothetical protein
MGTIVGFVARPRVEATIIALLLLIAGAGNEVWAAGEAPERRDGTTDHALMNQIYRAHGVVQRGLKFVPPRSPFSARSQQIGYKGYVGPKSLRITRRGVKVGELTGTVSTQVPLAGGRIGGSKVLLDLVPDGRGGYRITEFWLKKESMTDAQATPVPHGTGKTPEKAARRAARLLVSSVFGLPKSSIAEIEVGDGFGGLRAVATLGDGRRVEIDGNVAQGPKHANFRATLGRLIEPKPAPSPTGPVSKGARPGSLGHRPAGLIKKTRKVAQALLGDLSAMRDALLVQFGVEGMSHPKRIVASKKGVAIQGETAFMRTLFDQDLVRGHRVEVSFEKTSSGKSKRVTGFSIERGPDPWLKAGALSWSDVIVKPHGTGATVEAAVENALPGLLRGTLGLRSAVVETEIKTERNGSSLQVHATLNSGKRVFLSGELSETETDGRLEIQFRATSAQLLR